MTKRRLQFSLATLLIAMVVCAIFVRLWPRQLEIAVQIVLGVWTASVLTQLLLLTWVWAGAPTEREKRRTLCYSIALPFCVMPIVNWLAIMIGIISRQQGHDLSNDISALLFVLFLVFVTAVSLVTLPISFLLYFGNRSDPAFWTQRLLAIFNLVASIGTGIAASAGVL